MQRNKILRRREVMWQKLNHE